MGNTQSKRAIFIAGPTASGKSAVAIAVADSLNGVVINADSMQLYAELRVLTSRPSAFDEACVPHRLYGCVRASEVWSAGKWLEAAGAEIDAAWAAGKVPVIAGGTGLYFKALEQGLSPVPEVPAKVREHWRQRLKAEGPVILHGELDPADAARLKPGDSQRIVRALEVQKATGRSLTEHFAMAGEASVLAGVDVGRVALTPPRAELYNVCDMRFETMMARGGLDEVERLVALKLNPDLPAMKAIGVQPLGAYLKGDMSMEDAVALAQRQTRNYAKRQMTWIRNQMSVWPTAETRHQATEVLLHA